MFCVSTLRNCKDWFINLRKCSNAHRLISYPHLYVQNKTKKLICLMRKYLMHSYCISVFMCATYIIIVQIGIAFITSDCIPCERNNLPFETYYYLNGERKRMLEELNT